jgi:hypothetical protein
LRGPEFGHGLAVAGDDDLLPLQGAVDETRKACPGVRDTIGRHLGTLKIMSISMDI